MLFKVTISKQSCELSSRELGEYFLDLIRASKIFQRGVFLSLGYHFKHVGRRTNTSGVAKSA